MNQCRGSEQRVERRDRTPDSPASAAEASGRFSDPLVDPKDAIEEGLLDCLQPCLEARAPFDVLQAGKAKGNLVARNDAQAHVFRSGEKGLNLRRGILLHQLGENVDVEQVRPNHASELSSAKGSPLSPDGGGNSMSEPRGAVARRNCPICRIARTRSNSVDETTRHGSCAP